MKGSFLGEMEARYYPGVEADIPQLLTDLRRLFDEGEYETQTMQVGATTVLQARKSSTWRDLTGLSYALTIKITPEHGGTRVEIGMQKWFDKAAIAAVAALLSLGPLLALPALGAYWQYRLTEDAWKIIEEHIAQRAGGYIPPMPGRCGTCGAAIISGADFCSTCGADLRAKLTCEACGTTQRDPSARFCGRCGKPLKG
ncbi:Double zinc ribbon [Pyrinomonas methylaliphatogenes]|uniref:Double zinc ribbon n=2 Tax=Pyrinomonas methylaliphatogenes TaxID=454194 RepID=A0A0B6X0Y7_9BACT|nr:Double zinc ribbon [Pyrinomonas methylaliphatogenes]